MNNETPQISITQISTLTKSLKNREWINTQFDTDTIFPALYKKITRKQYDYILALMINKKAIKLRELLINLGVTAK